MNKVTDPDMFYMNRALRRVAETYKLPAERVRRGCLVIREELNKATDPDHKSIMDKAIVAMMEDV